jgi:two-component system cell cycle response regulator DivK
MMAFNAETKSRILLIEDDYGNRVLFTDFLKYCGYQVLSLADGTNFLGEIEAFKPDLILLDLKLPKMNGLSIIEVLRHHTRYQELPILVVSGYAFKSDRQKAMALGATGYLVKPIQPDALHAAIQSTLVATRPKEPLPHWLPHAADPETVRSPG